jgi:hypothetical protein
MKDASSFHVAGEDLENGKQLCYFQDLKLSSVIRSKCEVLIKDGSDGSSRTVGPLLTERKMSGTAQAK